MNPMEGWMTRSLLIILLLVLPAAAVGQVDIAWIQPTGGISIAVDADDNVYTAYQDFNPGGDITLTKRDGNGNFLWARTYDQTDNSKWDKATWVATDPFGNALVAGSVMSGFSNPVNAASILMKYAPDGTLLWRKVYETSFDGSYTKKCLIDENANVYVLGMGSGESAFVAKVKKFAPDGTAVWSYFDADGIGAPINFKFAPGGDIVIACRAIYGSVNGYARITRDGQRVWSYPGVNSLTAGDAAGDHLGNTYLVHGVYENNGGTTIKKLSPTGSLVWSHDYALSAFRVEVGSDDCPVACGFPSAGAVGAAFIKVDGNGNLLWANLDADGPYAMLAHSQLLMDSAGNTYLAAGLMTAMGVCKVSASGASEWTASVSGGGYALGIALGAAADVYVVGGSTAKLRQAGSATATEAELSTPGIELHVTGPNPLRAETSLSYRLSNPAFVDLSLHDPSGRSVATLVHGPRESGRWTVSLDARDLPAGVYFARLTGGSASVTRKLTVLP
jgi:hypothetical protein